jgi:DNA-binding response OmpR family regulator
VRQWTIVGNVSPASARMLLHKFAAIEIKKGSVKVGSTVMKKGRSRAVLAEDNPADVFLVRTAFDAEKLDLDLVVKKDGEEMLNLIEAVESGLAPRPDIVLIDINLPKYSGAVLLEKMREGHACANIPVVIVTSSDSPVDRALASRFHISRYFRKPTDLYEFMRLGRIVRELIGLT